MHPSLRVLVPLFLLTAAMPAQDLRKGIFHADLVVVGRQVGKKPFDTELTFHRLQVVRTLRGTEAPAVTVLDWPNLGLHFRPSPRQQRLYCLTDASATALRMGLPASDGPYFKMVAWAGSNPLIGADLDADPVVRLAGILAAAEKGSKPAEIAADLCDLALQGDVSVRAEAAQLLGERPLLRTQLSTVQWSQLVAKATGESTDIAYKIALCELCAEQRVEGLYETLVVGLGPVKDPEFARCVGRIGSVLAGEDSAVALRTRLAQTKDADTRRALLLALGASGTDAALQTLIELRNNASADDAVLAGLKEHRSPRAKEAVLRAGK